MDEIINPVVVHDDEEESKTEVSLVVAQPPHEYTQTTLFDEKNFLPQSPKTDSSSTEEEPAKDMLSVVS